MSNNVVNSQYDISQTFYWYQTFYVHLINDKNIIPCKFRVRNAAFKTQTKLNFLMFDEGKSRIDERFSLWKKWGYETWYMKINLNILNI